ncbi:MULTISPECIES: hypothetical protein [unclassified Leeuwenhoekiella]|uniref:hypothetical protein n=1 Tax=unclassified Leeuwenhoekiella TaxID=2615029 RepID=UPI000C6AF020|nr:MULTISPECIES: hypothetical protein [unclassified Leeuwenhoekiella]MAW96188.1 hypothetical protein [Leeuwenhoekiella sp.]MBA80182.1 hypothetical protein [Leeuwenhoekiella sp.]|tara:strand:+ start:29037 stop:30476 length:1440 start_codon:yes stop_codon:yes gene_type:complete
MSKYKHIAVIFIFLFFQSCDDTSWKEEIKNLKEQVALNSQLIKKLQSNIYITDITNNSEDYIISFSDDTSITITNGYVPIITIGENGNWHVDGLDTGKPSQGENGSVPKIEIGENGNWYIDGVDTERPSRGRNGYIPKMEIGQNGNWFIDGMDSGQNAQGESVTFLTSLYNLDSEKLVFIFSDGSSIEVKKQIREIIVCWGDSLTAGGGKNKYSDILQNLIGSDYNVINAGVGGENSLTIAARQGGIPMYLSKDLNFPQGINEIIVGNFSQPNIQSLYDDSAIRPLLQGGSSSVNSCIIDGDKYFLKWTGKSWNDPNGSYTLARNINIDKTINIPKRSIIFTSSMRNFRNNYANIFFIGQNGGWSSPQDLATQLKKMIDFSGSPNYLILGLHTGSESYRKPLELLMEKEFGANYLNLRKYMVNRGLADAQLNPTSEDLQAIESGKCPPQLLGDSVHFNEIGYYLIGNLLYERFKQIGVF